jgi:transposase
MARVEVITGRERRRRWSEEQKRAIVAASLAPGAVVADIARRADISAGQIYRWRQEMRTAAAGRPSPVSLTTVASASATMPPSAHCAALPWDAGLGCSPVPIAAASVPQRCTR